MLDVNGPVIHAHGGQLDGNSITIISSTSGLHHATNTFLDLTHSQDSLSVTLDGQQHTFHKVLQGPTTAQIDLARLQTASTNDIVAST
jgi:hypothetical protein